MKTARWTPPAALAAVAAVALLGLPQIVPAQDGVTAFTGATLHPVSGPPIENGILLVEGSTIAALGDSTTAIPPGAEVVDLSGLHLYPGLVHSASDLGLVEIDSVRATVDSYEVGDNNSNLRAEVGFHADSVRIPPAVGGGILTAHVATAGGYFPGTSAVMRLEGWNWEEMTILAPAALHLEFPEVVAGSDDSSKAMEEIEEVLARARDYGRALAAGVEVDADLALAAMQPMLDGELPLWVRASGQDEIRRALEWLDEQGISNAVFYSGYEAGYVADELADRGIPVVLSNVLARPRRDSEPYDFVYRVPTMLHEAGVPFAIAGTDDSSFARNLPFEAAMAAAHGLPRDAALRSITLGAAEILGVDDRVGSLDVGKEASFFAATGDPLEIVTSIERVWIAGREVDLEEDHQRRLWRKYDARPRPTTP